MPEPSETSDARPTGSGFGRVLVAVYAIFAVAATGRSTLQLATKAGDAPVPYALSALAAVVYIAATIGLSRSGRTGRRLAWTACGGGARGGADGRHAQPGGRLAVPRRHGVVGLRGGVRVPAAARCPSPGWPGSCAPAPPAEASRPACGLPPRRPLLRAHARRGVPCCARAAGEASLLRAACRRGPYAALPADGVSYCAPMPAEAFPSYAARRPRAGRVVKVAAQGCPDHGDTPASCLLSC